MSHNKSTLVLLHGWGFNSAIWQMNLEYLQTHYNNYNILPLDLNGHGEEKYNQLFCATNYYLEYLISKIPVSKNINILGWSLGGIIALQLKAKFPEVFNKVFLCASTPCFINNDNSPFWIHGVNIETWDKFSEDLLNNYTKTLNNFMLLQTMNAENNSSKKLYKQLVTINNHSTPASIDGLKWGLNILKQDYRELLNIIDNNKLYFILGRQDRLVNQSLQTWLAENHPNIKTYLLSII